MIRFTSASLFVVCISACCPPAASPATPAPVVCAPIHKDAMPLETLRALALADLAHFGSPATAIEVTGGPSAGDVKAVAAALEDVNTAVREVGAGNLVDGHPLQYSQILNDCEDRAEVAAAYLVKTRPNWAIGKVFVSPDKTKASVGKLTAAGDLVSWNYHVAPFVVVSEDGHLALRVIDPAFHGGVGLTLTAWLSHFVAGSSNVKVSLRPVDAYNLDRVPGEDDLEFCKQADLALTRLRDYRDDHALSTVEWTRHALKVHRITGDRVWFVQPNGHRTGWFLANDAQLPFLEEARKAGASVDIAYNVVKRGFFKGRFFYLVGVQKSAP